MEHSDKSVYILAVSGGIDSVVLLDMLTKNKLPNFPDSDKYDLIVAHVNHGIRPNASKDQEFVRELAKKYKLTFETTTLSLGADASEELARDERYKYLESLAQKYHTTNIVIAHHAGDVVETAIINIIRGTGRSGLSSLKSRLGRTRPLLAFTKEDIREYAASENLHWVEDETNADNSYLRNHVRNIIIPKASDEWNSKFATHLQKINTNNDLIDTQIAQMLQYRIQKKVVLKRSWFVKIQHDLSCEIMRAVLRMLGVKDINKELIERLVISLKVGKPGTYIDVDKYTQGFITKRSLRFIDRQTRKTHNV